MAASVGHVFVKSKILLNTSKNSLLGCSRCMSAIATTSSNLPHSFVRHNGLLDTRIYQVRTMSNQKGFFKDFVENIRSEMSKNKEMKENLKKFREEAEKLEHSEALKKARQKFEAIQSETSGTGEEFKKKFSVIQEKIKTTVDETGVGKKGEEIARQVSQTVGKTAETLSKSGEQLSQTKLYKSVSEGVGAVRDEAMSRSRLYRPPVTLRKREDDSFASEAKVVEANEEAMGVTLHKDSKFYESWKNFKDNNQFVNKMFDMKAKYDESDHVMVRATRSFTDKFSELFGGLFSRTELSEVLTEIVKMDPSFERERFVKECQNEIIPNVLEAMTRPELEILKDWCHEAVYNTIAQPITQAQAAGFTIQNKVLDVNNVDLAAGKMMEQGPVLVFTFTAQQILCVRNKSGAVIEGDPEKIMKIFYVWAFCRDQTVLDPRAAWRIIDVSSSPAEQWL